MRTWKGPCLFQQAAKGPTVRMLRWIIIISIFSIITIIFQSSFSLSFLSSRSGVSGQPCGSSTWKGAPTQPPAFSTTFSTTVSSESRWWWWFHQNLKKGISRSEISSQEEQNICSEVLNNTFCNLIWRINNFQRSRKGQKFGAREQQLCYSRTKTVFPKIARWRH